MSRAFRLLAPLLLLAAPLGAGAAAAAVTAFTGATAYPVSGPPVENAVLLVEDGKILAVGPGLAVPAGAAVVDLSGRRLYPGFIHPASVLGLIEIGSVRGTVDTTEIGDINSDLRVEAAFHGDSMLLPPTMAGGVLTAHVVPQGGVFRGTSALMALDGWTWEDMLLEAPVGAHLSYPALLPSSRGWRRQSAEEVEKRKNEALEAIERTLDDAEAYGKALRAAADGLGPAVEKNAKLEALLPVLAGELPLFIEAAERTQIESALEWAEKRGLDNLVLVAGPDAAHLAEELAERQIPVILDGVLEQPPRDWEPYDTAYTAAARLYEAGVRFCIGDGGGGFGAANARNLPFHAAMAAAFGLPPEVALRSVTLSVAEVLGVDDRLGSLEPGKDATFIATDGDPLEILTRIERAWIGGQEVDLSADRQKRLYEKWRARPRPADSTKTE